METRLPCSLPPPILAAAAAHGRRSDCTVLTASPHGTRHAAVPQPTAVHPSPARRMRRHAHTPHPPLPACLQRVTCPHIHLPASWQSWGGCGLDVVANAVLSAGAGAAKLNLPAPPHTHAHTHTHKHAHSSYTQRVGEECMCPAAPSVLHTPVLVSGRGADAPHTPHHHHATPGHSAARACIQ